MPDYRSNPVDLGNPSWSSLLDALRVVHEGGLPPQALMVYHKALTSEWAAMDRDLRARMERQPGSDDLRMARGSLALSKVVLDGLPRYVESPTAEQMAYLVQRLVDAIGITQQVQLLIAQRAGNPTPPQDS